MNVETRTPTLQTGVRWIAAALVLGGGIVHLKLWDDSYKDYPNDNLGRMFLLNVVVSAVAAVAVAVRDHWAPLLGALGVVVGTLFMFGISRVDTGVPFTAVRSVNFSEKGFDPSPEALLAVVFEVGAAAALVAALAMTPTLSSLDRRR